MNAARRERSGTGQASDLPAASTGYETVRAVLVDCEPERRFGVVRVTGEPGGLIYLADGGVIAIETSGAPGADAVLLRSGRIREPEWTAAFTSAAAHGQLAAELTKRGLIGAAELEAVLRITLADSMFAVASGLVEECALESGSAPILLPLSPPASPTWLLAETARRLEVLARAADASALVRHDRDRVTADPERPAVTLSPRQEQLLALANGRRTARDMAFVTGQGVYAVSLELTRMNRAGLVTVTSRRAIRPPGDPAKKKAQPREAEGEGEKDQAVAESGPPPPLPRRSQPGRQPRPGPAEVTPPPSSALHRLLRLFPAADHDSGRDPAGVPGADADS
jgi:hypothetical protein